VGSWRFKAVIVTMPAMLDDPDSPTIYRVSGEPPYPDPHHPALPPDILPRQVTLRDRQTIATIVPFASRHQIPASLLLYLSDQFNKEIEGGDTYPMMDPIPSEKFSSYWFQNFGAIMLLGSIDSPDEVMDGKDWAKECLGSFYIKPNYPGRSSHVCNAGFLVTDAARNRGVGRLMGESYLDWAPKLGYSYSVFNLVYETNVASCKIWDALGFKRIGRVKGCGNLKSYPGRLIDAIIYGRDLLGGDGEELVSEERFDKIKFYLKYGKYPNGADRAEKSRLRSAATHYKLLDGDKLMLKDKEVIADPLRQLEIARSVHVQQHGGINKTTATIAEKFHWKGIKETVSDVIRSCVECKELGKTPMPGNSVVQRRGNAASSSTSSIMGTTSPEGVSAAGRILALPSHHHLTHLTTPPATAYANPSDISVISPSHTLQHPSTRHNPMLQDQPDLQRPHHHHSHSHSVSVYQPIDPQIINQPGSPGDHHHHNPFEPYHSHAHDHDPHTENEFQELLRAAEVQHDQAQAHDENDSEAEAEAAAAVDRELDMLIGQEDEDDMDHDMGGVGDGEDLKIEARLEDERSSRDDASKGREIYDVGFGGPG
jgi:GNAT superfamily N-acetyltransferase